MLLTDKYCRRIHFLNTVQASWDDMGQGLKTCRSQWMLRQDMFVRLQPCTEGSHFVVPMNAHRLHQLP